jgi:hypothetical protein
MVVVTDATQRMNCAPGCKDGAVYDAADLRAGVYGDGPYDIGTLPGLPYNILRPNRRYSDHGCTPTRHVFGADLLACVLDDSRLGSLQAGWLPPL